MASIGLQHVAMGLLRVLLKGPCKYGNLTPSWHSGISADGGACDSKSAAESLQPPPGPIETEHSDHTQYPTIITVYGP